MLNIFSNILNFLYSDWQKYYDKFGDKQWIPIKNVIYALEIVP